VGFQKEKTRPRMLSHQGRA